MLKTLIIFAVILSGYYFLLLVPRIQEPGKLQKAEQVLTRHHANLVQNRVSFIELTRLDPDSANFDLERSDLVARLQETSQDGLELVEEQKEIPELDEQLNQDFPEMLKRTGEIYDRQQELLERVYATDTYDEGIEILGSDGSVKLLTEQTNLILKYEFYLDQLNQKQ